MLLIVKGFNWIHSKKDDKDYTIVHCESDIPFQNGEGTQNVEFFFNGTKKFVIGETYEPVTESYIYNGQLNTRVVDLK